MVSGKQDVFELTAQNSELKDRVVELEKEIKELKQANTVL